MGESDEEEISMKTERAAELETRRKFLKNCAVFPIEELAPYNGLWIAWSP